MGSDIYTESAVAIKLEDFVSEKINKKSTRAKIVDDFVKAELIKKEDSDKMIESKDYFMQIFMSEIKMSEGYEEDSDRNNLLLNSVFEKVGIDWDDLPDFSLRMFDNCRESGYDVELDVLYLMFEPYGLFETVMTEEGEKLAKNLGLESISETTWTVHSY